MDNDYGKNSKIKLGNKNLLDESYEDPKNQKLRITTWIDGDVYDALKALADSGKGNGKYQTVMNEVLRSALFPKVAITNAVRKNIVMAFASFIEQHPEALDEAIEPTEKQNLASAKKMVKQGIYSSHQRSAKRANK